MDDKDLLGYLLEALDENAKAEVERYLNEHPESRERLALLQQKLEPLGSDKEASAPPPLLVERTLAKVAEHICAPKSELPQSPPVSSSPAVSRSWWRRADIIVAACLLLTLVGVSLIVLARLRGPTSAAMMADCKNNLRTFFDALHAYHDQHGQFPDVSKEAPRDVAGMVVPILANAGVLADSVSIRCAGIGAPLTCQFSLTDLRAMSDEDFEQRSPTLTMCYAYSLGYRDPVGGQCAPGVIKGSWSQTPIMADRPPAEGLLLNSINHGGTGQNVLFADGSVQFLANRTRGGDDIFINRAGRVAAGLDAADIVLGYSAARP